MLEVEITLTTFLSSTITTRRQFLLVYDDYREKETEWETEWESDRETERETEKQREKQKEKEIKKI